MPTVMADGDRMVGMEVAADTGVDFLAASSTDQFNPR